MVCAVKEIEKSTLFGGEGGKMCPRRSKIDFIAKCLNTFVAHCTCSYADLVSLSTIKAHVNIFLSITIVFLSYAISFYHLLHIRSQLTVLMNVLCYTSLCTSSTLDISLFFFFVITFFSLQAGWVSNLTFFSYLKVASSGDFLLWAGLETNFSAF